MSKSAPPFTGTGRGLERYYIALRSDLTNNDRQGSINPYLEAYWAYTAVVIQNGFGREPPLWFIRGLAAFMGNTLVRGSLLQVSRIAGRHLQELQTHARPRLRELLTTDEKSPRHTNGDSVQVF